MSFFLQFVAVTVLFILILPRLVRWYVRRYGVSSVVCVYIHRSEAEYLNNYASLSDTLPCDIGQLFSTMPFKRATHSANGSWLAGDFTTVLFRTTVREVGVIECYEGEKALGVTHTVLLNRVRCGDVLLIDEQQSGKSTVSNYDIFIGLLVWYSTLPLILFSNAPKMGYKK